MLKAIHPGSFPRVFLILLVFLYVIGGLAFSDRVFSSSNLPSVSPNGLSSSSPIPSSRNTVKQTGTDQLIGAGTLAFGRGSFGRFDIWTLDDLGGTNVATQITGLNDHDPVFSSDGKKILFRSFRDGDPGSGINEIYSMNPDGYDQTRLTSDAAYAEEASYSPDGTQIVFLRDGDVWKMDADGTAPMVLVEFDFGTTSPSYSPDSAKILFEHNGEIWLMDADGSNLSPLNNSNGAGKPKFSPNGTKVIFDSNENIYTIDIDGTNETELINGNSNNYVLENPIYSPDGTKIVMRCTGATDGNICTANANGTGFLAQPGTNVERWNPVWSSDSLSIAYLDRDRITNKYRIFTNTVNGNPTQVYQEDSNDILEYLAWQPVCIDPTPTPTPTPPNNLVGWWRAENNADDSSNSQNNGTLNGNTAFSTGRIGQAFTFDGNGDYVEVPDSNSLDVQTGDYTLAAWVKLAGSAEHYIAGKGACGENSSNFYIGVNAQNNPFIDISNSSGGSRVGDGTVIPMNEWHHLVLRKQGTNFIFFMDGDPKFTHVETGMMITGGQPFTIGKGDSCASPQLSTNGAIDEVRLYNSALTDTEIQALYNSTLQRIVKSNLVCQPQTNPAVSVKILYPNPVGAGRGTQGEVKLANGAPSGGTTVNLVSADPSVMTVPTNVTVPEGFVQANFPITTTLGNTFRSADVIATLNANSARATVTVAPATPDLAASNVIAPATVNILENFTASWTITNVGQAPTASYREDGVWISPDNILFNDPNDRFIGNFYDNDGVLGVNASKTISFIDINIPSVAIPTDGTYYLFVHVGGNINERNGDSANNYSSRQIQVLRNLPDLVAENVVAPAEVEPNVLYTVNWSIRNAGSRASLSPFSHNLYFSFDATVGNADDILITQRSESPFGINQSQSYAQQFTIPTLPGRPSSDSFVYVKVDVANQVFEDDPGGPAEINNTTTRAVRFEYRVPDLQVQTVTPPVEVESDTEFALAWTSTNAGNKIAAAFNERVFFSTDNIVNANDVEIGSFALPSGLSVGQSLNRIQNVTIPTNSITTTGDYFVYVKTDADSVIDEGIYENNNVRFQQLRVRRLLRPDLQVTNITAPATALFDQQIQVQWTINNAGQGPTNSPNWTDELLLGVNQTLNGANRLTVLSNISYLNAGESYIATATIRIPRGSNGSYYLIVKTDRDNTVNEENETNNLTTRPITINVPPLPDLRVSNVQAPAEGFAGQPIAVSWTVTNNGDGATPTNEATWSDAIYLSQNTVFDGGDTLIGTRQRSGILAVGGSYTVSNFSVNLPLNLFGPYYVFIKTDYVNEVYEFTSEGNNTEYDQIQPGSPMNILGTPPDLTVLNPITAPTNATAGNQITVQFTVRNQGAFDATGFWREAVFLSSDQTLDVINDTFLGNVQGGNLPAGQQYGASMAVTIPNCLQGTYYLFAVTDSNENIFEFDAGGNGETNNISQPKAIELVTFVPDLRVTQMTVPPVVINGAMPMSWTVKNFGTAATTQTSWVDRVFINTGSQTINLGYFQRNGALAIDAEYTQNQVVILPNNLEGSFQVFLRTDTNNSVPECTLDNNNDDFRPTSIQQNLPDMRITGVDAPGSATLGSTFNVSWGGANFGTAFASSTSWADAVYLSNDATFNFGDRLIGGSVMAANLATGATYNAQASASIPNVPVGNYFLIVNADNGTDIEEGVDENNNASTAIPITITAPQVDLQVTNITTNPALYSGQFADISWTATNLGTEPTVSGNWSDWVVLSRDSLYDASDRLLEFRPHSGVLNGGTGYTETRSVQIPAGLTGEYNILVITDRHNNVTESNDTNNISAPFAVNLQLPPPAELNITNITPPASVTLGDPSVFTWTVQNASTNTVNGTWQDSIYLSTDTIWDSGDMLIGQKQRSGTLASFATYTETLNSPIPPVETGTYFVIVRTDARNTIRESIESNNVSTSAGQTTVGVPNLTLGTPVNTTLVTGQEKFYSVLNTPADETMLVTLTGQSGSSNELYTRFSSMVSRANYEFQGERQGEPDQENIVPNTIAGTYYTMARGDYVPSSFAEDLKQANDAKARATIEAEAITIKAELLPFGIRTVSPGEAGNQGYTMVSVKGSKFVNGASVKMVGSGGVELIPKSTEFINSTHVAALFNLEGKAAGNYQIVLTNPNSQTSTWSQNFVIRQGGGAKTRTEIYGPTEVRGNFFTRYTISVSNEGLNDALKIPIVIILSGGAREYKLSRANYVELDDSDTPVSPDAMHYDVDDKRVIALYAPIVRSNERVDIGIDVKFSNRGDIEAFALPSIHSPAYARQFQPNPFLELTGEDVINCWANFVFNTALTALGELLPLQCAKAVASFLAGDLAQAVYGGLRTGSFVSWWTLGSLVTKALRAAAECAKNLARYFPPAKAAAILYDILQGIVLFVDCLDATGRWVIAKLSVHTNLPQDPNDKVGPFGYGPEKFVPIKQPLTYRINFENVSTATAPAHRIRVIDQLPPTLDPRTVRLTEIGFKQYKIEVPPNRAFYQGRLQLGADLNDLQANISAGLNITTGTVTWTLTAIDPATGEEPINPNVGLLPPNNAANDGQGYVSFTVEAKSAMPTRTNLANQATIYFDDNEPIVTNVTSNLLDADVPLSQCSALPATSDIPNIPLSWAGSDDPNGSGLASYDVFVSENGGAFLPFIANTTATSATFNGKYGKSYRFYSVAHDNAGNLEAAPATPDAVISVLGGAYESDVASRPNGNNDGTVDNTDVGQVRRFAAKLDTDFQYNEFQRADSSPLVSGGNGTLSVADVVQARRYATGADPVANAAGPNTASLAQTGSAPGRSAMLPRALRPYFIARAANTVVIGIELESEGDEVGVGFSLNFNTAVLGNPANITVGNGATGATLTVNTSEAAQGRLGILLDKLPGNPFVIGARQIVMIEFDVLTNDASTMISFGGIPVVNEIVNGSAGSLTTTFTDANVSLLGPTAAGVTVSGRITDANGSPIDKVGVVMINSDGQTRRALTNPFGIYSFEDVEAGQTYVVSVQHKRYRFTPPTIVLTVNDSANDVNFVGERR